VFAVLFLLLEATAITDTGATDCQSNKKHNFYVTAQMGCFQAARNPTTPTATGVYLNDFVGDRRNKNANFGEIMEIQQTAEQNVTDFTVLYAHENVAVASPCTSRTTIWVLSPSALDHEQQKKDFFSRLEYGIA
jgi:hypothetical protein